MGRGDWLKLMERMSGPKGIWIHVFFHIQCYFHCTPLVLINLTSHFLLSGAERKRGCSIFYYLTEVPQQRALSREIFPFSLWTPGYQSHPPSLSSPSALHGGWWDLQRHERDEPQAPLPTSRGARTPACQVRSTERQGLVFDLLVSQPEPGSPGTPGREHTSKARVQPVKYSSSSLKGFRGGEGWKIVSSKNKFSRKRQLVSTLSRSISRHS